MIEFSILSRDEVYKVHMASLHILEKIGLKINSRKALEILAEAGAYVDFNDKRVRMPQSLVEEAIRKAPATIKLCGLNPKLDILLEGGRVHYGTGGTATYVLDLEGNRRDATLQDLRDIALLTNELDNVDFFHIPVHPRDVPREVAGLYEFHESLKYCMKPVEGEICSKKEAEGIAEMLKVLSGGKKGLMKRPLGAVVCCSTTPLLWDRTGAEILIKMAEEGIPTIVGSEPQAGATSPATLAGTLSLQNAETLGGIVLTQLVNPGTPAIYGTVAAIMDPRLGTYCCGAIEVALLSVAATQMAHFYRLPVYATGGMTDSKIPDVQASYEKAMISLLVGLSGADLIHDAVGFIESALTYSLEQMVIDDEILGMCKRVFRGIEVNDETLGLDVIEEVGPAGQYLTQKHTVRHIKTEFYLPKLSDRKLREEWEREGAKDARIRAREMAHKLLEEAKRKPLGGEIDEDLLKEFDRVFEREVKKVLKGR